MVSGKLKTKKEKKDNDDAYNVSQPVNQTGCSIDKRLGKFINSTKSQNAKEEKRNQEKRRGAPERENEKEGNHSVRQSVCELIEATYWQSGLHYFLRYMGEGEDSRSQK